MKPTDNFFARKREWSRLKDEILGTYLVPYLAKIVKTQRPILIVDAFAGKGRFDDGESGSPLIIAEAIARSYTVHPTAQIRGLFIERKYHRELATNVAPYAGCRVLAGTYEEHVQALTKGVDSKTSLLLFIDPYGIKSLDFQYFRALADRELSSLELILNFNTFGFLREGCRLLSIDGDACEENLEPYEEDPPARDPLEQMDAVAGGQYWQDILHEYYEGRFDMRAAEQAFADAYRARLRELFRYVVDIPVQCKRHRLPKYRLLFGTQSPDGLILMADDMNRTWRGFVARGSGGQTAMFEEINFPDMVRLEGYNLEADIVGMAGRGIDLKALIVRLFERYGITYSQGELDSRIKTMEKSGVLIIDRDPPVTATGRPVRSMDYRKYRITVRRR